jgi:hypothetical protein
MTTLCGVRVWNVTPMLLAPRTNAASSEIDTMSRTIEKRNQRTRRRRVVSDVGDIIGLFGHDRVTESHEADKIANQRRRLLNAQVGNDHSKMMHNSLGLGGPARVANRRSCRLHRECSARRLLSTF